MVDMEIKTLPVGPFGTNCYLAWLAETETLCVIDPGAEPLSIAGEAKKFPAKRTVILLTHAHVDHISGLGKLCEMLHPDAVYLDADDLKLYHSPLNALEPWFPAAENLPATTENPAVEEMKILKLPGHSRGGAGFYFPADQVLFSGDSIFAGSIGRTDLPGGDWKALQKSLKEVVLQLPDDTSIRPGHGPATTVGYEKATNPYLAADTP